MYLCLIDFFEIEMFICTKVDLTLDNPQRLICHETKKTNQKRNIKLE